MNTYKNCRVSDLSHVDRQQLIDQLTEVDDYLLNECLLDKLISSKKLENAIVSMTRLCHVYPVVFGAAIGFYIEPLPLGSGIIYTNNVNSSLHSSATFRAVEEGAREYLAPLVIFKAIKEVGTRLLWPINHYKISIPNDLMGKAMSDISAMGGRMDEPIYYKDHCIIEGDIPVENSKRYHMDVNRYTSGMGYFETRFKGYEIAPVDIKKSREKYRIDPSDKGKYLLHIKRGL